MHGDEAAQRTEANRSALALDRNRPARERARGRAAKRHNEARFHRSDLPRKPPAAGSDLAGIRLLVDASLAARLELEMLDCIRDVDRVARNSGFRQRAVEELAGRPNEGASREI